MRSPTKNSSLSTPQLTGRPRKQSGEQLVTRGPSRVADQVFESIARAIFEGELRPGDALRTHRELAKEFDASPILVRQAIHRLEELSLVRVRHGSGTIVLDPDASTDIRMLQLRIELAEPSPALTATVIEVQTVGVVPMLMLAERRMSAEELVQLRALTEALPEQASDGETREFVREYWHLVGRATRNFWFEQQVRWWWMLLGELRKRERAPTVPGLVHETYRRLTAALIQRRGAVLVYCDAVEPLLQWLDRNRSQSRAP